MTHDDYARSLYASAPACQPMQWSAVLFFYAALHGASHVVFRGTNAPKIDHVGMAQEMSRDKTLRTFEVKYRRLRTASEDVRYRPWVPARSEADMKNLRATCREILTACGIAVDA